MDAAFETLFEYLDKLESYEANAYAEHFKALGERLRKLQRQPEPSPAKVDAPPPYEEKEDIPWWKRPAPEETRQLHVDATKKFLRALGTLFGNPADNIVQIYYPELSGNLWVTPEGMKTFTENVQRMRTLFTPKPEQNAQELAPDVYQFATADDYRQYLTAILESGDYSFSKGSWTNESPSG